MRNVGELVTTEHGTYNKRHLQALIRRKMMAKTIKSKKVYSRKNKHKHDSD